MTRGRRSAIAGVAGGVLGAGALGAWLALPAVVREEAVARIEQRTGLHCTIGDVSVGPTQVVLRGVSLADEGGAVAAELDAITLDAGPFALATRGLGAATTVAIAGGDVRVLAVGPAWESVLARVRGAGGSSGALEPTSHSRPRVIAERISASVSDQHGELVRCAAVAAQLQRDRVVVAGREIVIASGAAGTTRIDELELTGSWTTISRLTATGLWIEISGESTEVPGALARLRGIVRSAAGGAAGEEEEGGAAGPLRAFDPEFAAELRGLAVRRATPEGPRDVLTGLDVTVDRLSAAQVRTRGAGRPDGGGRLAWDLRVEPRALRAEGSVDLEDVALAVFEPLLPAELPLHRPEDARLSGSLRIEGRGDSLQADGRLTIRDLALAHPRIAPEPIRAIAFRMEGRATFIPAERRLEIASLRVESGAANAVLQGAIEWAPDHYLFDLTAQLPPTPCSDAVGAIPVDLLQDMAALSMSGTISGRIQARVDSRDLDSTQLAIRVADGCRFELVPPMADLTRFEGPFVHRVEEPDGSIFEMETGPGTANWVSISSISPFLLHAVLGHEDGGFFRHEGFSTLSIREALVRNLREGRYVMGASTISMQLVKNVFLRREKTLARKVQEVLLTWWIESAWPKHRILELYLNVIEFGPGVYGIRNAARHYFGVEPADLSPAQAAYLASILPNPKLYHEHYVAGALPPSWVARLTRFLRILGERGRFDAAAVEEGVEEIGALRFHREGDPAPPPRAFRGHAAPLPIEAAEMGLVEAQWELADVPVLDDDAVEPEGEEGYE